jgi:glc operon protein GlcG
MKTKPVLTMQDCEKIQTAARAEAVKNKWNVTIAIVDDGGHLLSLIRGDGAPPVSAEIAEMKAHGAAVARRSTKVSEDRIASRPALVKMPVLPVQGGVPILHQGECVGGVGVSGVQSHEDEIVCNAGIAALGAA